MRAPPCIETRGLTKSFREGTGFLDLLTHRKARTVRALDNVDLEVHQGEMFALLGPNGAGKSTLVKILSTLVLPSDGRAAVCGFDVVSEESRARAQLSLVIGEERSFYWRLTGRQNLAFFAALYDLSPTRAASRIKEAAAAVGLEDLDRRYQEYSTGNKQKLALARSMLGEAKVVLMDEPTRSLDPGAAARLRQTIKDFARSAGRTVFFTTHNTQEAEQLADRVAILDQGRLKACGTLSELRRSFEVSSLEEVFLRAIRKS